MYTNLKAQIKKKHLSYSDIAKCLGVHLNTLCNKVNAKHDFTIQEALLIWSTYFKGIDIEHLFSLSNKPKGDKHERNIKRFAFAEWGKR